MVEHISIHENNLLIELGELEARVMSKALPLLGPLFAHYIYMMTRVVLLLVPLGKDGAKRFKERIERGEDVVQIMSDMGIDPKSLVDKSIESISWPTEEEIDRALGWLDEQ